MYAHNPVPNFHFMLSMQRTMKSFVFTVHVNLTVLQYLSFPKNRLQITAFPTDHRRRSAPRMATGT